jgi:hypothetical protein
MRQFVLAATLVASAFAGAYPAHGSTLTGEARQSARPYHLLNPPLID